MKLHVLTACTRPHNLGDMAQSMRGAAEYGVDLTWHIRLDLERQHVGGQLLKNKMLDQIAGGWVYILDDDNLIHPRFFQSVAVAVASRPDVKLLAIAQQSFDGSVRKAKSGMLRETHVDAGQVVIERQAIGDRRIPLHYCGDGAWIEAIASTLTAEQIAFLDVIATYYNWLRGMP